MKLVWTDRFAAELRREYDFIRARNPKSAVSVRDRILSAARRLKQFPQMGRGWRVAGTRELVVPGLPYIIIYEISNEAVVILSIFHSSRDDTPLLH